MIIKRTVLTVFLFTSLFAYSPSRENLNQRSVSSTFVDQSQLEQKTCGVESMPFNAAAPDPFDPSSFTRQDRDVEIPINYHVIYVAGDSIYINVSVDNYYYESMWDIRDNDNNTFLLYPGFYFDYSGQSYSIGGVLPPGNYALFMYDDYGDGGVSATVTTSSGEVLASINANQWGQYTFLEFVAPEGDFTDGLISNEDIEEQTDALNSVYNELGYSFYTGSIDSAVNAGWYYATDSHIFDTGNWSNDDQYLAMAEAMTTDVPSSINFFWTGMYNTSGLGVYPWSFPEDDPRHGLACGNYTGPGGAYPFNQGYIGVHEVGHYIGLYHTFENGCSPPGDEVDDTPYQSGPNYGCPSSYYSCGSYDDIGNYMDFMDDNCLTHFTDGQVDRINWALETYRPTLLEGSGENDGVVWYVSTDGSDENHGSEQDPFASIQVGIDSASDGDTVLVAAGNYIENINYNGKNIVVIGEDKETTIIDGGQNGSVITFESDEDSTAVLSGFTITNGWSIKGGGIYCENSNPNLFSLIVSENTVNYWSSDGGQGGGIYCTNSNPTLSFITISSNNAFCDEGDGRGGGIFCENNSNLQISNVQIESNTALYQGGGIYCNSSNPSLVNVTITNNSATDENYSEGGGIYCENSSLSLVNSILWNDTPQEIYLVEGSINVNYSDVQSGWEGEGNIDADPLFCAPDSSDYTLAENSPCVGSGEDGANMGAFGVGCGPLSLSQQNVIPTSFVLQQNYPNPFNPVTLIKYDLPEQSHVNINIYDMMGRQVKTLINGLQTAGYRSTQWNATNDAGSPVSAGLYLYTIQAGEFRQTKKMVLLK